MPSKKNQSVLIAKVSSHKTQKNRQSAKIVPHGIRCKNNRSFDQPGPGRYFWLLTCVSSGLLDYLCNHRLYLWFCTLFLNSILVTTPQYQPPTKVCVPNRLISEKWYHVFSFVRTGFPFLFSLISSFDFVLSTCPNLFSRSECGHCSLRFSMGWWLLRLSTKILALLRLSVNFFQLRLTKKLKN